MWSSMDAFDGCSKKRGTSMVHPHSSRQAVVMMIARHTTGTRRPPYCVADTSHAQSMECVSSACGPTRRAVRGAKCTECSRHAPIQIVTDCTNHADKPIVAAGNRGHVHTLEHPGESRPTWVRCLTFKMHGHPATSAVISDYELV